MVGGEIETDTVNYMAHMVSGSCAVQSHAIQSLQAYYAFRGPLDRSELLLHTELDADWGGPSVEEPFIGERAQRLIAFACGGPVNCPVVLERAPDAIDMSLMFAMAIMAHVKPSMPDAVSCEEARAMPEGLLAISPDSWTLRHPDFELVTVKAERDNLSVHNKLTKPSVHLVKYTFARMQDDLLAGRLCDPPPPPCPAADCAFHGLNDVKDHTAMHTSQWTPHRVKAAEQQRKVIHGCEGGKQGRHLVATRSPQ